MPSEKLYRKPDGSITRDPDEYGDAWMDVFIRAEKIFEGYKCSGGNPYIELDKWEVNGLGYSVVTERIKLTIPALELLERKIKEN